jgi:hypothetical protein
MAEESYPMVVERASMPPPSPRPRAANASSQSLPPVRKSPAKADAQLKVTTVAPAEGISSSLLEQLLVQAEAVVRNTPHSSCAGADDTDFAERLVQLHAALKGIDASISDASSALATVVLQSLRVLAPPQCGLPPAPVAAEQSAAALREYL